MARYTLTMPDKIMDELKLHASKNDCSIKDVVRKCLKFGLIGMDIIGDKNKKILIEENGIKKEIYFIM